MNTDTARPDRRRKAGSRPAPARIARPLRLVLACLAGGAALAGAGCGSLDSSRSGLLEPYRIDLPQGNYVTREQVDQVREGMPRDQVRFLLGTPLLGHVFHTDRWDYVFSYRHPSGHTELRRVTIRFANDRVTRIEADESLPAREDASDPALPGYRPADTKSEGT